MSAHRSGIKRGLESSDDEADGYETDEYYDEQGRKVVEIDYGKMRYIVPPPPFVPLTEKQYTMEDMTPTVRDPLCQSSTMLACFWPVYVDNFKDHQISLYFASHGLHVRWWFRREDEYFKVFQNKAMLYDMLVYFVSERDAKLAVERCHRDTHKGYTLNVFPGREPVYFREDRSVYAKNMKSGRIYSEHFFEKHVKFTCKVQVNCVVKFDMKYGALEFKSPGFVPQAQRRERMWTYLPVQGKLQKQRYLEQDVLPQIEKFLAENPTTLDIRKTDQYMKKLLSGDRPYIDKDKKYRVVPYRRGPGKKTQMRLLEKKMKRKYGVDGY